MSENKTEIELDGSIYEIKTDSTKNEWIVIGRVKKYLKICHRCSRVKLRFLSQYKKENGKLCRLCCLTERNKSEKMRKLVSQSKLGTNNHFYGLTGNKNPANRPEVKVKLKEYQNRPEVKEAHRKVYVDMMNKKRYPGGQFYNKIACEFMDEWGTKNGYNFEHAVNGKELKVAAYWVDGYDKEKNAVFEYDEPHHYFKRKGLRLKNRDLIRMKRIQEELKCDFIRYNELTKTICYHKIQP